MSEVKPVCPFCGSSNVLPFEEDNDGPKGQPFLIVFISAFLIIGFYFLFVILSYMSYPIMVIVLITLFSLYQRRRESRKNRPKRKMEKDFLCIHCGRSFSHLVEVTRLDHPDSGEPSS